MSLLASRYTVLGDRVYRRADGALVRVGYLARRARYFTVDVSTADTLQHGDIGAITPARRTELVRLGVLVDSERDELGEVLAGFRAGSDSSSHRRFTIMPTAYCNMGCSYCGQEHFKSHTDSERVARLVHRVESAMAEEGTRTLSVTWFGGEPLLGYRLIAEMSERFVAQAQETDTKYYARMATNGSLITVRKLEELHHDHRLRQVDITIDGPREIHDRRRVLKNGKTSYDRCVAVLGEVARRGLVPGLGINIRVNVDAENEADVPRLLRDLSSAGLNLPRFSLQFMPVHSWGNDVSGVELEAGRYAAREVAWLRLATELGFGVTPLPTAVKATTCVATTRSGEIHDPSGLMYSCSEHPLVPGARDTGVVARLADLAADARRPTGAFDDWYEQVAEDSQACHRCPFLPVCGGSCPKLWREGHLPCPSFKFNVQDRMDLAATGRWGLEPAEDAPHAAT